MKVSIAGAIALLLFAISGDSEVRAQSFGRPDTPAVSPYLNLIPGRTFSPTLNYFGTVRPQLEFRRNERRLNQSISNLQKEVRAQRVEGQKASSFLGVTGHRTAFHNYGSYFPAR